MKLAFTVLGIAAPQGSMKGFVVGKRAMLVHANARTMPWRAEVAAHADRARLESGDSWPTSAPVLFSVTFHLPRPASHFGKKGLRPSAPQWPAKKPDLSKLVRAAEDALSGIVYDDDARIVIHGPAQKVYANFGEPPRAEFVVETLQETVGASA